MKKYRTILIVKPSADENAVQATIEKYSNLINSDGKIDGVKENGLSTLAYPIQKNTQGYFVELDYESNPELQSELNRLFKIDDALLKYLTIKID